MTKVYTMAYTWHCSW